MLFKKGRGKKEKTGWKWQDQQIEEVKRFKYLGYTFQRNNGQEEHIKESARKARIAAAQVWGIGERRFKESFIKRMMMFNYLVKEIMLYGAEIWGWEEKEEIEAVQQKYLKWVLKLDKWTPNYIVLEETKRKKIRVEAGNRALKYEGKIETSSNEILKECKRVITRMHTSRWTEKRRRYFERCGYAPEEAEKRMEENRNIIQELVNRDDEVQIQEQRCEIRKSRYNKKYEEITTIDLPEYLKEEGKKGKQEMIARFRCGNEESNNKYWEKEEKKMCKICERKKGTIEHIIEEYRTANKNVQQIHWKSLLGEKGEGWKIMTWWRDGVMGESEQKR